MALYDFGNGNVTLPQPMGFVVFAGTISTSHFSLEGSTAISLGGYSIALTVSMSTTSLALAGTVEG